MTPKQKVEALLRKTIAAGCPLGEVIAANELAVRLAIQYRIPSNELTWPALPAGHRWEGQHIVAVPKPAPVHVTPKARVVNPQAAVYAAGAAKYNAQTFTAHPKPTASHKPSPNPLKGKAARVWLLISLPGGELASNIAAEVGWQVHTVRGWVSIQNKARTAQGLPLIKTIRTAKGPLYHI